LRKGSRTTFKGVVQDMIEGEMLFARVLKTKFQVLRMMHRVSSPHLRIGYTVADGESFSDDTAAAFVSNIIGNSLMFLRI